MSGSRASLNAMLERRLEGRALDWYGERQAEVADGVDDERFASGISRASRFAPRGRLAPDAEERAEAARALPGWNPERWTVLEAVRVGLVLARPDLDEQGVVLALEEVLRFADEGEQCAMYRSLAHLPRGERFVRRASEGCRTNILPVFESVACDTPYPARHFGDLAWNQMVVKALFIGAPLWRVHGVDERLSAELARMTLDLADERRSAHRPVQQELWMCLGTHGGARALAALERELAGSNTLGRRAAALGLARAGEVERLRELFARERDPALAATMRAALEGGHGQEAFAALDERSA